MSIISQKKARKKNKSKIDLAIPRRNQRSIDIHGGSNQSYIEDRVRCCSCQALRSVMQIIIATESILIAYKSDLEAWQE